MTTHPPFRKVLDGVATREEMFQLFNRHRDNPDFDPLSGKPYSGEWFEIQEAQYHFMLGLLPPLFQRTGMFGMSEYKSGNVTSVFFAIRTVAENTGITAFATSRIGSLQRRCAPPSSLTKPARPTA